MTSKRVIKIPIEVPFHGNPTKAFPANMPPSGAEAKTEETFKTFIPSEVSLLNPLKAVSLSAALTVISTPAIRNDGFAVKLGVVDNNQ